VSHDSYRGQNLHQTVLSGGVVWIVFKISFSCSLFIYIKAIPNNENVGVFPYKIGRLISLKSWHNAKIGCDTAMAAGMSLLYE
jgi:hypothetical protein